MRKNNIALLGCSLALSTIIESERDRGIEIIDVNDLSKPEPMVLTNPYKDLVPLSFSEYSNKHNRKQNNRKKVKRKKAKNGKR